jgi:hypothetical protein
MSELRESRPAPFASPRTTVRHGRFSGPSSRSCCPGTRTSGLKHRLRVDRDPGRALRRGRAHRRPDRQRHDCDPYLARFPHGSGRGPGYFEGRENPKTSQDLTAHNCGNMRMATHGGLCAWDFVRDGRELNGAGARPDQLQHVHSTAERGAGGLRVDRCSGGRFLPHVEAGRLIRVLEEWSPTFPGYRPCYPSHRQSLPAFTLVVEALKLRD